MTHAFISYSRKDTAFVEKLERDLNARGVLTWRDVHSIPGGAQWFKRIKAGLEASFAVIYVDTPDAFESKWVEKEYLYAEYLHLDIVPVKVESGYVSITTINLNPILCDDAHYAVGLGKLVSVLNGLPRTPAVAGAVAPPIPAHTEATAPLDEAEAAPVVVDAEGVQTYLSWLLAKVNADLRDSLYVTLRASQERPILHKRPKFALDDDDDDLPPFRRVGLERVHTPDATGKGEDVPDARVLLHNLPRVLVLGDPGAGKTTTLLQMVIELARTAQADPDHALLPVFVPLRKFNGETAFEMFIAEQLYNLRDAYPRLVAAKRLILLCDAFNEMPRSRDTVAQVKRVLTAAPRWVVSCRVRDYQEELAEARDAAKVRLKPLDLPQIHEVIQRWFAVEDATEKGESLWKAMHGNRSLLRAWQAFSEAGQAELFWTNSRWPYPFNLRDKNYRELLQAHRAFLNDRRRMLVLCRNPYLLNRVCWLFHALGQLPDNRGALFADLVDVLLGHEEKASVQVGAAWLPQAVIRQGLAQLAYGLNQRTELPVAEAERVLAQSLPSGTDTALLLRLAMAANLLEVEGAVRFSHQLLQEYFASAVLGEVMDAKADPSTIWPPDRWWEPSGREETTILLAGVRADPEQVARWLAPAQPWFALELLQKPDFGLDLQKIRPETRLALVQAAKAKTAEPNPVGRAAAYRVLGVFDADDRFGLGLGVDGLPEFDWVDIPAGEFLYGDDKQLITLKKPFQISRYPVTYRQFQAFIDAPDGFRDPRWWDGLAADDEHKSVPRKQDFKFWNHPCDNVSWYDTIAFCRWLSYKLGGKWGLDELDEWPVRLPTEFEWEKAARGTDGREYSYEGEFDPNNGNGKETGIGQTSAVGMFSDGASPYGLLDMSGNVWEWCLSAYQNLNIDVPHENLQRADNRVRRGGSWDSSRGLLRAANRFSVTPFLTNSCYGFRCARSSRTE